MAKQLSPLTIRIQASGSRQVEGEIRRSAGFLDVVVQKAQQSNRAMSDGASGARQFSQATSQSRGAIAAVAADTRRASENTRSLAERAREGARNFRETANHAKAMVGHLEAAHRIYRALASGGPLKLLDAIVPSALKKKIGLGLVGAGAAEGAVLGSTVAAAGQMQMVEAGLKTNLRGSGVTVDEMMAALRDFDKDSQLDFLQSAQTANRLVATGVNAKEVIPMMRAIGDAVGAQGGDQDSFDGIARALQQIQTKGKYSAEEGQQLGERGIDATGMISKATGIDKATILAGKADISGEVAVKAILDGMREKFAGGMAEAAATLPGQIATLNGAIFQLKAALGQYLLPAVSAVVSVISGAVNAFNNLPEPIHQIIAYSMAFNAGLLILIGTLLIIAGPIGTAITLFKVLTFTLPLVNKSILQLAWSLMTTLMPSLAGTALTIGTVAAAAALLAVIAGATYLAVKGYQAATSQSAAELEAHFGYLGQFWVRAGDALSSIQNHPFWNFVSKVLDPLNLSGTRGSSSKSDGDAAEAEALRLTNERRKKRGLGPIASQSGRENDEEYKPADKPSAGVTAVASGAVVPVASTPVTPGIGPMLVGAAEAQLRGQQSGDVQAAQKAVDSLMAEVQNLQDRKRTASKEEKVVIAGQLVEKQRALSAARRELAAQKTLSGHSERDAAKAEKAAAKRGDLYEKDAREIDKLGSENAYNERISDLQDELDQAREDADATRVRALTIQIARMTANREFDEAIIGARDEEDEVHRRGLEAQAKAKFDYASGRGALRAGQKAKSPFSFARINRPKLAV